MARGQYNLLYSLLLFQNPQYFVKMTKNNDFTTIKETFSLIDDWEDRYAYLIDLGKNLPPFPGECKTEQHLVKGCTSQVWMILGKNNDSTLNVKADSDAHIVRGLIALVIAIYNGMPLNEINSIDIEQEFNDIGLSDHLSPNRRNGFFAMVERVKAFN